jgi:uncharacterized protein
VLLMPGCVFAIPVLDRWLIHAPLHRTSAVVNRAAIEELASASDSSLLAAELDDPIDAEPAVRTGPVDPQFLGLVPTRACNLACVYCGFGANPGAAHMDPRLAARAVDWMAGHAASSGRGTLDVHFFGGEPFAAPEVVEVAVHRTRARAAELGLEPRLEVATNGFYGETWAQFAGDYFSTVVLSLDGFAGVQDRHRPLAPGRGSFDQVVHTARILSRSAADFCLRVCVAGDSVDQLAETVDWFCTELRPTAIDFEVLQPTPESERAGLRPPDPYEFARQVMAARQVALAHGVEAIYAATGTDRPRRTFCPLGNDALILHPDGRVSACYLPEAEWQAHGLDLDLGRFNGAMDLDAGAVARVRGLTAEKPRCERCFCRWSCAGGCHVKHSFPGCPTTYDDFCIQTRLIAACTLLDGLEQSALCDALFASKAGMERLASRPSDLVEDWNA